MSIDVNELTKIYFDEFCLSDEEKEVAQQIIDALEGQTVYGATEVLKFCKWAVQFAEI